MPAKTRIQEVFKARGFAQGSAAKRLGWHQTKLSRVLSGQIEMTQPMQLELAKLMGVQPETLKRPIGAPIPLKRLPPPMTTLDTRLAAVASVCGAPGAGPALMAYIIYGDEAALPSHTRQALALAWSAAEQVVEKEAA